MGRPKASRRPRPQERARAFNAGASGVVEGRWAIRRIVFGGLLGLLSSVSVARAEPNFLGAERCGACHQREYADWKASGHARALARLSTVQQRNPVCRNCHTMVPTSEAPELAGVQCESCHGPGRRYAPAYVMRDPVLSEMLGLAKIAPENCAPCHTGATPSVKPFDFAALLPRVRHEDPPVQSAPDDGGRPAS